MTFARMIKLIEKRRDAVGKERDKLYDLIQELSMLHERCEKAYDDLEYAIEALSEHA